MALGFNHPDVMLRALSSKQLTEWEAYYSIEPFGERMEWLRTGVLAATIANAHRSKRSRTFAPEDFMPKECSTTTTRAQSVGEQRNILHQWIAWAKQAGKLKKKE